MPSKSKKYGCFFVIVVFLVVYVGAMLVDEYFAHKLRQPKRSHIENTIGDSDETHFVHQRIFCPCTGTVYDADSKIPIKSAKVIVKINYDGIWAGFLPTAILFKTGNHKIKITETNADGKYKTPVIWGYMAPFLAGAYFHLAIYKAGYWAYAANYDEVFRYKKNIVYLKKRDDKQVDPADLEVYARELYKLNCEEGSSLSCSHPKEFQKYCREARDLMLLHCKIVDDRVDAVSKPKNFSYDSCVKGVDQRLGLIK